MAQTAAQPPLLIREEFREPQGKLYEDPNHGVASAGYAPLVVEIL